MVYAVSILNLPVSNYRSYCLAPSIPPLVPSLLPHPPLLPTSHSPSFLAPCLPPPRLPTSRLQPQRTPCMCVRHGALYCLAPSHA